MPSYLRAYYECPFRTMGDFGYNYVLYLKKPEVSLSCNHLIDASLRGSVDRVEGVDQVFSRHTFTANESRCVDPHPLPCDSSPPPPILYSTASFSQEGKTSMNRPIGKLNRKREISHETEARQSFKEHHHMTKRSSTLR